MSTGDLITAGEITTAYDTTDLVAEKKGVGFGGFSRAGFPRRRHPPDRAKQ